MKLQLDPNLDYQQEAIKFIWYFSVNTNTLHSQFDCIQGEKHGKN